MRTTVLLTSCLLLIASATAAQSARPAVAAFSPAHTCPGVEGAFVALLDPARGMLLLSGAPFPGGERVAVAESGTTSVDLPGRSPWRVERAGVAGGGPLWADVHPFLGAGGSGCVAFDRHRFSSEGDLATYLRWLVERVYLRMPEAARAAHPALHLGDRTVVLRVGRPGLPVLRLAGREGSTLAFRFSESEPTYMLLPFVLDPATGSVAVQVSATGGEYFDREGKPVLDWVVVTRETAASLEAPSLEIALEEVREE